MEIDVPRWQFVPESLDGGDLAALEAKFGDLEARTTDTVADAERWLRDESELHSRISATVARRYIAMTRRTDDDASKAAYLDMEQRVMPRVKVLADRLDRKFLASQALSHLDADRYGVLIRHRRTASEIFRAENTTLQKEEAELQTRQQALMGSVTVEFEGKRHTLQQMAPYFESQDRDLRNRAYEASIAERRKLWPELEDIYDQLIRLRHQMGVNAGFDTYTPFRFKELQRFDYGPDTCTDFHDAVATAVVPAVTRLNDQRRQRLEIESLRPWDLEVDLDGREPFRPFATEEELIGLVQDIFARVDERFAAEFSVLVDRQLLDLMSREGKAPGGYQYQLEDERVPFIFANSVGMHHDVQTLLHEGGHAFHSLLSRDFDLLQYRDSPIEFAETASMSMELLGLENLTTRYADDEARAAYRKHLEGILRVLPWIASIDAFQHWVYAHPGHSQQERRDHWLEIRSRFAPDVDWSGYEDALSHQWTGQTHLFNHAFYYIEYGIAQVAALQVWQNYRSDPETAIRNYRGALSLGGSRQLPELFAAAGVDFDLSAEKLATLVADIESAMGAQ